MPFKNLLFILAGILLTSCMTTTTQAPDPRYAGVEPSIVEVNGMRWAVFEKQGSDRVLARRAGLQGEQFSTTRTHSGSVENRLKIALRKHFTSTGRSCDVGSGTLITETTYEFRYTCKASPKPVRYCVTETECRTFASQGFAVDRSFVGPVAGVSFGGYLADVAEDSESGRVLVRVKNDPRNASSGNRYPEIARQYFANGKRKCSVSRLEIVTEDTQIFSYSC
ncbi:hypothetical protein BXY66_3620 [Shimia isoporae]|uniref:Lipoprotein n=1 Tax=Shimia isoporae TaxID=647720 RepID=A0A4R1N1S6_9RHOB|nr:hypothetical protein BXY66_3620 [Shimia isoporae]